LTVALLECVPNVSEGRDLELIRTLADAVRTGGATLLDVHTDIDHHRSVFTFVGDSGAVEASVMALARVAVQAIDLRTHRGIHPRIGAVDVVPFVPIRGAGMADAIGAAHRVGPRLARDLGLPVFYFGDAALRPERRELPALRHGQFEGLAQRMARPGGRPDAGPSGPHPRAGAVAVGARRVLIAFNAVLDTVDLAAARAVADVVRERSGGLPRVRALGVELRSRSLVQVTMNVLDYRRTPLALVIETVDAEADRRGLRVVEYELVGCAPDDVMEGVDRRRVRVSDAQLLDASWFGVNT
jgi:glutamate formiminotransferase